MQVQSTIFSYFHHLIHWSCNVNNYLIEVKLTTCLFPDPYLSSYFNIIMILLQSINHTINSLKDKNLLVIKFPLSSSQNSYQNIVSFH